MKNTHQVQITKNNITIFPPNTHSGSQADKKTVEYASGYTIGCSAMFPTDSIHLLLDGKITPNPVSTYSIFKDRIYNTTYDGYFPTPDRMNWWVNLGDKDNCGGIIYHILEFYTNEFIKGFVHAFTDRDAEFRNFVAWAPYTTSANGKVVHVDIKGYDMLYFSKTKSITYGAVPYTY